MTATYASLATGYGLVVPDLSGVAGFDARWALRPGVQISWTATRSGGTFALDPNAVPTVGSTIRTGIAFGLLDP